uniref:DUF5737 domain-containing protein n=1 Tax=Schistocephalus solidus TaxID=70667 RepID=A0A0X3Q0Q0_SCHSO
MFAGQRTYNVVGGYDLAVPPSRSSKKAQSLCPKQAKVTRFEELGYNYGFRRADPNKNEGFFYVYRCLKDQMSLPGPITRIHADENEIRLTELEGVFEDREKIKIFSNDISGYYKFNHRNKFVAICIDANTKQKTGYWFLSFDRSGQLNAFCEFLSWLFDLDSADVDCQANSTFSYVDRKSRSSVDLPEPWNSLRRRSYHASISEDSGLAETESDTLGSPDYPPESPINRHYHQHHRHHYQNDVTKGMNTAKSWRHDLLQG